ncbi:MAG: phytanoyl-CoA dioxygenase family protein [Rhodothermales bacterium]
MFKYYKLTTEQLGSYRDEGYLVIRNTIDATTTRKCREDVLNIVHTIGLGESKLRQTTQYLAGSGLDELVNSERLKSAGGQLMGGEACLFMPFTAVKSAGGGGQFHFHQDNQYTEFDGPGVNFWFALDKMTEANGCLWIAPRSHLHGTLPAVPSPDGDQHKTVVEVPKDAIPILMNPGDCVAFSRLTVHGSGANTTDDHRVAYAVQFHRSDVRARRPGEEWTLLKDHPRWEVGPVEVIKN